ncbi:MAG: NDP-sugar synthase, partial [Thermofilum sp.]|nr:NDP-sugar synthase [Thermofilum sp.]
KVSGWYATETYWIDVGRPASFLRANFDLLDGNVEPLKPYGRLLGVNYFGENVKLEHGATILPPVALGDNVIAGEGAVLGPYAVVGCDTFIGRMAKLQYSVVIGKTNIGERALIENSILAKGILVGDNAVIKENSVIGDGVVVKSNSIVGPGAVLYIRSGEQA